MSCFGAKKKKKRKKIGTVYMLITRREFLSNFELVGLKIFWTELISELEGKINSFETINFR